jgi:hypothetical protein
MYQSISGLMTKLGVADAVSDTRDQVHDVIDHGLDLDAIIR